jgi:pimeloyl-ACP methyl ester carboxylesterase
MREFAHDVLAAMDNEGVRNVVLVGHSLGGPVAMETALLAGTRVVGVIGVDTFHDLSRRIEPEHARAQAEAWRCDPGGTLDLMLAALFHPDAPPSLVADVRKRMSKAAAETMAALFDSLGGYDTGAAARQLHVPVRCINGDLYPINTQVNREIVADFEAVVLPHTGHFPMLERPREFNQELEEIAGSMSMSSN